MGVYACFLSLGLLGVLFKRRVCEDHDGSVGGLSSSQLPYCQQGGMLIVKEANGISSSILIILGPFCNKSKQWATGSKYQSCGGHVFYCSYTASLFLELVSEKKTSKEAINYTTKYKEINFCK